MISFSDERSNKQSEIVGVVKTSNEEIGNITNVMSFRGAFASLSEVDNPEIGDVVVITAGADSGKEFVYSAPSYVVCDTTAGEQYKILIIDGFVLSDGKKIAVKFTNSNTAANPYFRIITNTTTNYENQIYYQDSAIPPDALAKDKVYIFVYDKTTTHWNLTGGDWVEFGQETVLSSISTDIDGIKRDINDLKNSSKLQSGAAIEVNNESHKINLLYNSDYFSIDGNNNKLSLSSFIIDCGGATE